MRVAIAGGHGQVGAHLIRHLVERGDEVRSLDRNPAHADDIRSWGAEPVTCDLENESVREIADAIDGMDAVVFSVGAGPGSGPEPKWTIDYAGAVKLMAAAEIAGVRRYVIVSAISADSEAPGDEAFSVYLRAKGRADAELERSGLDYTVVKPSRLVDDAGTGQIRVAGEVGGGEIPREDVAATVAACLHDPATIGKSFELTGGDEPIEAALAGLA